MQYREAPGTQTPSSHEFFRRTKDLDFRDKPGKCNHTHCRQSVLFLSSANNVPVSIFSEAGFPLYLFICSPFFTEKKKKISRNTNLPQTVSHRWVQTECQYTHSSTDPGEPEDDWKPIKQFTYFTINCVNT